MCSTQYFLPSHVRLCTCALCTSWALSRNLTHQLLHLPPSDPLDQDTVTIASASCNCVRLLCFCSIFFGFGAQFCWVPVYLQYYWCLSSRISAFNLPHFHGFQVIANWRLAQIARAGIAPEKQTLDKEIWWYVELKHQVKASWSSKLFRKKHLKIFEWAKKTTANLIQ